MAHREHDRRGRRLAALEQRILLVDCDPQGNATRGLGQVAPSPHLYHVLTGEVAAADALDDHVAGHRHVDRAVAAGRGVSRAMRLLGLR